MDLRLLDLQAIGIKSPLGICRFIHILLILSSFKSLIVADTNRLSYEPQKISQKGIRSHAQFYYYFIIIIIIIDLFKVGNIQNSYKTRANSGLLSKKVKFVRRKKKKSNRE